MNMCCSCSKPLHPDGLFWPHPALLEGMRMESHDARKFLVHLLMKSPAIILSILAAPGKLALWSLSAMF